WELGINYALEGLARPDDALRIKAAYFHNDIDDYIGDGFIPPSPGTACWPPSDIGGCVRYQNLHSAEIKGVEREGFYDAGRYFGGLSLSVIDGHQIEQDGTRSDLETIPSTSVTASAGMRFLEERLTVGGEVQFNKAPKGADFADDYTLVNLYADY